MFLEHSVLSAWRPPPSESCGLLSHFFRSLLSCHFLSELAPEHLLNDAVPPLRSRRGLPPFFPAQAVFRAELLSAGSILSMWSLSVSLMRMSAPWGGGFLSVLSPVSQSRILEQCLTCSSCSINTLTEQRVGLSWRME